MWYTIGLMRHSDEATPYHRSLSAYYKLGLTTIDTLRRMARYGKKWDIDILEVIDSPGLSSEARDIIIGENKITESGKQGYLGQAIITMDGKRVKELDENQIWEDVALHLFTLRVVDDYVDKFDPHRSTKEKLESLRWEEIMSGNRDPVYQSPAEEAAVNMLGICIGRFNGKGQYITRVTDLYNAVHTVETRQDDFSSEVRNADIDSAVLTVLPIVDILSGYGLEIGEDTIEALVHLSSGTRLMDHLGDFSKDIKTGAFNPFLADAKKLSDLRGNDIKEAARQLAPEYLRKAKNEFQLGRRLINGNGIDVYNSLVSLLTIKYRVEYLVATSRINPSLALPLLRKFAKSF